MEKSTYLKEIKDIINIKTKEELDFFNILAEIYPDYIKVAPKQVHISSVGKVHLNDFYEILKLTENVLNNIMIHRYGTNNEVVKNKLSNYIKFKEIVSLSNDDNFKYIVTSVNKDVLKEAYDNNKLLIDIK